MIYTSESFLKENGDKLEPGEVSALEEALKSAKADLEGGGPDRLQAHLDALTQANHQLAAKLYGQAEAGAAGCAGGSCGTGAGQPGAGFGPEQEDDETIDAEYRDVA
jgi:molecular chaperone DnaK